MYRHVVWVMFLICTMTTFETAAVETIGSRVECGIGRLEDKKQIATAEKQCIALAAGTLRRVKGRYEIISPTKGLVHTTTKDDRKACQEDRAGDCLEIYIEYFDVEKLVYVFLIYTYEEKLYWIYDEAHPNKVEIGKPTFSPSGNRFVGTKGFYGEADYNVHVFEFSRNGFTKVFDFDYNVQNTNEGW